MAGQTNARSGPGMIIGLIFLFFFAVPAGLHATGTGIPLNEDFPIFPSIKPNLEFWKQVFGKYDSTRGLIHDTRHLDRVYEVITLEPENTITGELKNKKKKKAVLKQYKKALLRLAKGGSPKTAPEKRALEVLGPKAGPRDYKRAASNLRCQTGIKDKFRQGLIRSGAYIKEFRDIFSSHGLPPDLVFLACVESSFDVRAYSKFGAAGIWQFTRDTGRLFMEIDYVVDQRRDPFVATDAAARLLKKNYARLREWPSAITAYNHGLAGMLRAKKKKGSYEAIFNSYTSRSFRFASRNFYSEFLAARQVAKAYKTHFGDLSFDKPVRTTRFTTKGYVPVTALSDALGLHINELKSMNPALRPPVFKGQKYIPKGFQLKFPGRISPATIGQALSGLYRDRQKPSRFHRVRKGDTAGAIARTHGVGLRDLVLANGLGKKALIYIGQNLRIPVREEIIMAKKHPSLPASAPGKKGPSRSPGNGIKKSRSVHKTKSPNKATQPLENGTPTGLIPAKEPLPRSGAVYSAIPLDDLKVTKTSKRDNASFGIIKVAAEETLGHYADWLKISTSRLRSVNRMTKEKRLSIGQTIKIPLPSSGSAAFEEQRNEFHREIEEDFFESFMVSEEQTYEVKNGDSLWLLCSSKLEVPFWLLKKYNPVTDFHSLTPGQKIRYPVITKKVRGL